jgi:hypothetical protein
VGARLTIEQYGKTQQEIEEMSHVPYTSVVSSLMYAMVCLDVDQHICLKDVWWSNKLD